MQKITTEVLEQSSSHTPSSHLFWLLLLFMFQFSSAAQSCDSLRPHGLQHASFLCPSPAPRTCWNSCSSSQSLSPPCPPAFNLSHHQSQLFTLGGPSIGASTSSFKWIFGTDFLYDWLVWSPCSPSAMILEPRKIKFSQLSPLFSCLFATKWWNQMPWA